MVGPPQGTYEELALQTPVTHLSVASGAYCASYAEDALREIRKCLMSLLARRSLGEQMISSGSDNTTHSTI